MLDVNAKLSEKLAVACNILSMEGQGNMTLGHVTARIPGQEYIYMNQHDLGLEEITSQDVIILDFEGNQLAGTGRKHSEYPIHTEIYKMYPHINSVVHTHPFYSIVAGATEDTIKTISHEGSLFAGIPIFAETTMLIRSPELGRAVAQCLNGHRAALMRNHGIVTAGTSIEEATVYAVLLEKAAKIQVVASQVGSLSSSSEAEVKGKGEQAFYPKNIQGFWNYLVRRLKRNGGEL